MGRGEGGYRGLRDKWEMRERREGEGRMEGRREGQEEAERNTGDMDDGKRATKERPRKLGEGLFLLPDSGLWEMAGVGGGGGRGEGFSEGP